MGAALHREKGTTSRSADQLQQAEMLSQRYRFNLLVHHIVLTSYQR